MPWISARTAGFWQAAAARETKKARWSSGTSAAETSSKSSRSGAKKSTRCDLPPTAASSPREDSATRSWCWSWASRNRSDAWKSLTGTSELLFSPDGKVLVASGNGGFISMWSVTTWEKIFQLDALIGIRGVFDFHLVRGDLAFDGEAGLVRVLPKVLQQKLGNVAVEGVLQGTDV